MSTPDGYVVEGHVEDGEWSVLSAHRDRATAEAWIDDWPHWREAGARIRPFRYTEAPASGEPSGAEAVVREAWRSALVGARLRQDELRRNFEAWLGEWGYCPTCNVQLRRQMGIKFVPTGHRHEDGCMLAAILALLAPQETPSAGETR